MTGIVDENTIAERKRRMAEAGERARARSGETDAIVRARTEAAVEEAVAETAGIPGMTVDEAIRAIRCAEDGSA